MVSEYKRFRGRAEDYKKGTGALLAGADYARALEWRDGTFARGPNNHVWQPTANWADRYRKNEDAPSNTTFNEVLKFIDDSYALVLNAKKTHIAILALITQTALSFISTIGAFGFAIQSHNSQIKTEAAFLWIPLDFNSPIINVTEEQLSGLLKLESAEDAQKRIFFDQLMKDQELAERFINNPEVIMTAMVGISPARKKMLLDLLDEAPHQDTDIFRLARFLILSELEVKISSDDIMALIALKDKDRGDLISRKILYQLIKTLI
jgi:hypothetical protein